MASTPSSDTGKKDVNKKNNPDADEPAFSDDDLLSDEEVKELINVVSNHKDQIEDTDAKKEDSAQTENKNGHQGLADLDKFDSLPPGFLKSLPLGCFSFSGLLILLVAIGCVIIMLGRYYDYFPLKSILYSQSHSSPSPKVNELTRNYILIATYNQKLYYFDGAKESFIEASFGENGQPQISKPIGTAGVVPSIDVLVYPDVFSDPPQIVQSGNNPKPKIAIIVNRDNYQSGIYIMDFARLNGPDFVALWTKEPATGYNLKSHSVASWSPDGNTLAFVASKEGRPDLFTATLKDKLEVKRITHFGQNIGTIQWISSKHIAFVTDTEGKEGIKIIDTSCCDTHEIK